jgi:hypothetical protein
VLPQAAATFCAQHARPSRGEPDVMAAINGIYLRRDDDCKR